MKITQAKISSVNLKAPAIHAAAITKMMSTGHVMGSAPKLAATKIISSPKMPVPKMSATPAIKTYK